MIVYEFFKKDNKNDLYYTRYSPRYLSKDCYCFDAEKNGQLKVLLVNEVDLTSFDAIEL